ncbi:flagellar basal body-associated FliL family protein [Rhodovibrio salinarum]|uniref:Flagellar protein FliL n=1 Tax=Rhodovibrio salinarum TaxID=1087 RepID=A0A934V0E2_9PROT|nr:flagellar basal body-associated FliL family protein [Rhodovibrio salinarum]MBK1697723.1 flagellar basal body protein FliL [Rhodovibrio salinarum]
MTDQTMGEGYGDDVELDASPRRGGMSGKKITLFVLLPLLLLAGAGAGLYFTGMLDSLLGGGKEEKHEPAKVEKTVFYEMPTLLVNLNSSGRSSNFLKLSVSLEIAGEAGKEKLEKYMPRVVDNFQVYLRELRVEDLQGSAGLQRLREELLLRVNAAVEGVEVKDVLFKEMLVQ